MTQAVRYDANMAADLASLALYDEEGRILLQHRDANARNSPDHWGFFGGHMEEGETPEEAMRRELMEEIEYAPLNPVFLHEERFVDPSYDPPARRSILPISLSAKDFKRLSATSSSVPFALSIRSFTGPGRTLLTLFTALSTEPVTSLTTLTFNSMPKSP